MLTTSTLLKAIRGLEAISAVSSIAVFQLLWAIVALAYAEQNGRPEEQQPRGADKQPQKKVEAPQTSFTLEQFVFNFADIVLS